MSPSTPRVLMRGTGCAGAVAAAVDRYMSATYPEGYPDVPEDVVRAQIETERNTARVIEGRKAPEFELAASTGGSLRLSELIGSGRQVAAQCSCSTGAFGALTATPTFGCSSVLSVISTKQGLQVAGISPQPLETVLRPSRGTRVALPSPLGSGWSRRRALWPYL